MWMDGWSQIYNTSKACMLSFFLSSILICCLLQFAHSQCILLMIVSAATVPQVKTCRQTDRQRVEGEIAQQPPTAPIQIYYLCCRSGHFTAVFTLDPAVSIRWQGLGLQMWLPIHRSTTSLSAEPPLPAPHTHQPHFLICPLTLLIKKKKKTQ